jgi:hypothetical protein
MREKGGIMKTFLKSFAALFFLINYYVIAEVGCMDNSYHAYLCPYINPEYCGKPDYKTLHFVTCYCPCRKFKHGYERDKCFRCGHYHDPQQRELLFIEEFNETLQ